MATLAQVVAKKVGDGAAAKLIEEGSVKVNGTIDHADHQLYEYDVVEFRNQKLCYVGWGYLVEAETNLH